MDRAEICGKTAIAMECDVISLSGVIAISHRRRDRGHVIWA